MDKKDCCTGFTYALEHKLIESRIALVNDDSKGVTVVNLQMKFIGYTIGSANKKTGRMPMLINFCPFCATKLEKDGAAA